MRTLALLALAATLSSSAPAAGFESEALAKREPSRVKSARKAAQDRLDGLLAKKGLGFGDPIFIRAFKEEAELELWMEGDEQKFVLLKKYAICAASGELGPKERVGDEQVPEGFYAVGAGAMNPASSYHLSFNIGYPNQLDKKLGRTGSLIMIHGDCVSIGCLAMTDEGIQEIYSLADAAHQAGQKAFAVHVFPFRMTTKKMAAHETSPWVEFWKNLKVGYDLFQKDKVPPKVSVKKKQYAFESAVD
jgi:murein L,D-transpeptidase YafK